MTIHNELLESKEKAEVLAQRLFLRGWHDGLNGNDPPQSDRWAYTQGYAVGVKCGEIRDRYWKEAMKQTKNAEHEFDWGQKYHERGFLSNSNWTPAMLCGYNARKEMAEYRAPLLAVTREVEGKRREVEYQIHGH